SRERGGWAAPTLATREAWGRRSGPARRSIDVDVGDALFLEGEANRALVGSEQRTPPTPRRCPAGIRQGGWRRQEIARRGVSAPVSGGKWFFPSAETMGDHRLLGLFPVRAKGDQAEDLGPHGLLVRREASGAAANAQAFRHTPNPDVVDPIITHADGDCDLVRGEQPPSRLLRCAAS